VNSNLNSTFDNTFDIPAPTDVVEVRQATMITASKLLQDYVANGTFVGSPTQSTKQKHDKYRTETTNSDEDSETNLIINQKKNTIKGATVDKLIEKLTEEGQGRPSFFAKNNVV
jgi:hypothetical protein